MEGLTKITKKIIDDAEKEAKHIAQKRDEEVSAISESNKKILKNEENELQKELGVRLELLKNKELSKARLEAKKNLLSEREHFINEIIAAMKKKLVKDYDKLLKERLGEYKGKNIKVTCSDKDKKIIESAVKSSGVKAEVFASKENTAVVIEEGEGKQTRVNIEDEIERFMPEIRKLIGEII